MKQRFLLITTLIYFLVQFLPVTYGKSYNVQISDVRRNPKFITFNTNSGKIEMALDLSLPFLSIPLEEKNEKGGLLNPSLKINANTLGILSILTVLTTLVFPWFRKDKQKSLTNLGNLHHYREKRGLDLLNLEDSVNEILFKNNNVKSCMQKLVCWAVATANHSENPSNIQKIIYGVSRHRWFDGPTNGAAIKEAVWKGRKAIEPGECNLAYSGCAPDQQFVANILNMIIMQSSARRNQ